MSTPLSIAVIIASSRPDRVGPAVAHWVMEGTQNRTAATYELVDLAEQDLPNLDEPEPASSGNYTQPHTRAWAERVAGYDAFVFVTPEYNHGIPGQLKNALDFLYAEWNDKVAGIVCYGSNGGFRAAEQLKLTLNELQVAVVRAQVELSTFDDMQDQRDMAPRDYQPGKRTTLLAAVERWAGALRPLRDPASS
ncbi:NADPH-dependent FMN reductase [Knoellia sp. Soil729]|uniref:NADPH-dependent FMN reductase n=1 Tax=Knoellia sp. Soil729 TaxID=1736394 RepID=UPI000700D06E|nr:NAD(P)H-dependent oxidoreductase [Knoellia sp. Soil729]KRE42974.1 NADPH-dependent FMN reductase [Knoellia sp. Soil729]